MPQDYHAKEEEYFGLVRHELLRCIPNGPHKILEIGAGDGSTGAALKNFGKAIELVGVELVAEAAAKAEERLDRVICGDIEKLDIPYPEGYFDYIVCGDVLEHLVDPWSVLRRLKPLLTKNGKVVASIPNVRYRRVLVDLAFRGEWKYTNVGILDRTHLRFFTKKGIHRLFAESGYRVETIFPKYKKKEERFFNLMTLKVFDDILAWQYIVLASDATAPQHVLSDQER